MDLKDAWSIITFVITISDVSFAIDFIPNSGTHLSVLDSICNNSRNLRGSQGDTENKFLCSKWTIRPVEMKVQQQMYYRVGLGTDLNSRIWYDHMQ